MKPLNYGTKFIELASEINSGMPEYWVGKAWEALNEQGKSVKGSKILVIGVAYKPDIDDVRESPALDIICLLQEAGADVSYHDPYVPKIEVLSGPMRSSKLTKSAVASADVIVIATSHASVDREVLSGSATQVVNTRSVS